jgi:hypothetical protein
MDKTPVKWISKRQKTIESSTNGSEMVAARMAIDLAVEFCYALQMLGVEVDGPAMMFGGNKLVIINTMMSSSQLKMKHSSIAYHQVQEAIAAKIINSLHIYSEDSFTDALTKPLPVSTFY